MMKNLEVARLLYHIADLLEMQDVAFKPQAYRKAARSIEELTEPIEDIKTRGELEDILGVGTNIAKKISEFLDTGKLKYYEDLKKQAPFDVDELTSLEGVGPKLAKKLYDEFGIRNIKDLEKTAKTHKIAKAKGFGELSEKKLLEAVEAGKGKEKRMLLDTAEKIAEDIIAGAKGIKGVKKAVVVGSFRRRNPTVGDLDILVLTGSPAPVMRWFCSMPEVGRILAKGEKKSAVLLKDGVHVDLRVIPGESFGAALQYFTGSKEHNVVTRSIAKNKGMKLNEYGLFRGKKKIAGESEEDVYRALGMQFVEPELRENRGEVEAALKKKLPTLIKPEDIKGDLHSHTNWSEGKNTIDEMAEEAKKLGYEYLVISDHGGDLPIANALDEKRLKKQIKEIDRFNKTGDKKGWPYLLKGSEINIKKEGGVDVSDSVLKELDVVVAAIHAGFHDKKQKIMKRLYSTMENEHVDIIGHPTGRILGRRKPVDIDFEKLVEKAKATGTVLEINSVPERLDLDDSLIFTARGKIKFSIGSDAHSTAQLHNLKYGISMARRGWCTKTDVLNTQPMDRMLKLLK